MWSFRVLSVVVVFGMLAGIIFGLDPSVWAIQQEWPGQKPMSCPCPESVAVCDTPGCSTNPAVSCLTVTSCHEEEQQTANFCLQNDATKTSIYGDWKPCRKLFKCMINMTLMTCVRGDELPASPTMKREYKLKP